MIDVSVRDARGYTCLHIAAERNLLPVVKWLCETCNAQVGVMNYDKETAWHVARNYNYKDIADYLWERWKLYGPFRIRSKTI